MRIRRCLYCYQKLEENVFDFHPYCSRNIFGNAVLPGLTYTDEEIIDLAQKLINRHSSITGVQPKLSLDIEKSTKRDTLPRFTIMGFLGGRYILKLPTKLYRNLPELEDLTMHLAKVAEIEIVPHSLIRMKSGQLAYITKRIDRVKDIKLHMEDMCQLTGRLTEDKYKGSYEQIGKAIVQFSSFEGIDLINFFEQVVFCFLTGNNDMHLKNFSLISNPPLGFRLSPGYDMVAVSLINKKDKEQLALRLNGKKSRINRKDFDVAMNRFQLDERVYTNIFSRFVKAIPLWHEFIKISFIPNDMKNEYHEMIDLRAKILKI